MKAGGRTPLHSLRRRVRSEVHATPRLVAERKRLRKSRPYRLPPRLARALLGLLLGAVLVSNLPSFEAFLGTLMLWATFSIFVRAWSLRQALCESDDLVVWAHLPIADGDVFMRQWQRGWLRTLWSFSDMIVALTLGALHFGLASHLFPMLFFAAAHWLIILAGAILVVAYLPRLASPFSKAPPAIVAVVVLCGPLVGLHPGPFLEQAHAMASWFLPSGWFNLVLHGALAGGAPEALTFTTLPVVAMIVAGALSWQRLRRNYGRSEMEYHCERTATSGGKNTRTARATLLQSPHWFGTLERAAGVWLGPREKDIALFMAGERPGWTRNLQLAVGAAAGGLAGAWLAPEWAQWWIWTAGLVAALFGLPVLGGYWRAFEQQFVGGRYVPLYAVYPAGYAEMAAAALKVNIMRCAAFLPLALIFGCFAAGTLGAPGGAGIGIAFKLWLLVFIWQPALLALRFATGTNDTRCSPRTSLGLAGLLLGLGALSVALALAPGTALTVVFTGGAAPWSFALMKYYQHRYEKGRFDLLSPIQGA